MIVGICIRYCFLSLRFFFIAFAIGWSCANPLSTLDNTYVDTSFSKTTGVVVDTVPNTISASEEDPANKSSNDISIPDTNTTAHPLNGNVSQEKPAFKFLQRIYLDGVLELTTKGVT